MRKLGFILIYISVGLIGFGLGWMIGIPIKDLYMKEACDSTTNFEWYITDDCMRYYENPWEE